MNLVVLVLYFGCQVVSDVADVSDLVFDNQGDVGTHRKRYLKKEAIQMWVQELSGLVTNSILFC